MPQRSLSGNNCLSLKSGRGVPFTHDRIRGTQAATQAQMAIRGARMSACMYPGLSSPTINALGGPAACVRVNGVRSGAGWGLRLCV